MWLPPRQPKSKIRDSGKEDWQKEGENGTIEYTINKPSLKQAFTYIVHNIMYMKN